MTQKQFSIFSWITAATLPFLGLLAWGTDVSWDVTALNAYQWFPLFGLIAWLTMASHYLTGYVLLTSKNLVRPNGYKKITGYLVLISLLLHPLILAVVQYNNQQGIPPASFINYVGSGLSLAVMLGSFSLLVFLSFEFFDRMKNNKKVLRYWTAISISQSLAMTLVWVHGLRLGSQLTEGWFKIAWFVVGLFLLPCFYVIHRADFKKNN